MTGGRAAWAFSVASDRDKAHPDFVFLEFLLKDFFLHSTLHSPATFAGASFRGPAA